jgi:hypothetical protein
MAGRGVLERTRELFGDRRVAAVGVAFLGVVVYLVLFVARVGGDFMYARFLIPVVPFFYFLIEGGLRLWGFGRPGREAIVPVVFLLLVGAVVFEKGNRDRLFDYDSIENPTPDDVFQYRGITDEHWYYTAPINYNRTRSMVETGEIVGRWLEPYFEGLDATFLLSSMNMIGYYGKFRTCIEKNGLTDETIAHEPLPPGERKTRRTGHVKFPSREYLVSRGVDFSLLYEPPGTRPYQKARFRLPDGMTFEATLVTYDRELVAELSRRMGRDFLYVDFEAFLDEYIANVLPERSEEALRRDFEEFRDYYFRHNEDPERLASFLKALGAAGSG